MAMPHGGPHYAFVGEFDHGFPFLAHCGFAVALINYRGSTGYGVEAEASVLGRVGEQDVLDVQASVLTLLTLSRESALPPEALAQPRRLPARPSGGEVYPLAYSSQEAWASTVSECVSWGTAENGSLVAAGLRLDADRVSVVGHSHGGFLCAHLIAQFPDTYRAAVPWSAVTNLAGERGLMRIGYGVSCPLGCLPA